MSPAIRCLAVLMAAAGLGFPAVAGADDVRGVIRIEPLPADVAALAAERWTLVRLPAEQGPLYPYVDPESFRVALEGAVPLIVLGGSCPGDVPLGSPPLVENPSAEPRALVVSGADEPTPIEPGGRVGLERPGPDTDAALLSLEEPGTGWRCDVELGSQVPVQTVPRTLRPGELAIEFSGVAWPEPANPNADGIALRIWLNDRPLCPDDAGDDAGCVWSVALRGDGTFEDVRLDVGSSSGAAED